jgi:hypothetical protein
MRPNDAFLATDLAQDLARRMSDRLPLRLHMLAILLAVVASGAIASKLLLVAGLGSMGIRYPMSVAASYAVFYLLVRIWLWFVAVSQAPTSDQGLEDLIDSLPRGRDGLLPCDAAVDSNRVAMTASTWIGDSARPRLDASRGLDADRALAFALFGALLVALLGVATMLAVQTPLLLAETLFQAVLVSLVASRAGQAGAHALSGSVLADTWAPFAAVTAAAALAGWWLAVVWPGAIKLADILR